MFAGVQYHLSQQEYDELVAEEIVTRRFAISWDSLILPFRVPFLRMEPNKLIVGRSHPEQFPKFVEFIGQISC